MRLSAALIVRNEAAFLEGCLVSIAGHVDEIVVVDTGSTDRTMDIARAFGARLLERAWRNDFAWARNEGLAAATGDWILYIDADERLSLPPGASLADNLDGENVFAGLVGFRPRLGATPYREYRLFRNDPRLRFKGAMHETILPDLRDLEAAIGAIEVDSPAELLHLGFEGDLTHKHHRNLPLLRTAVAEDPDRTYFWLHLGNTQAALGDVDQALRTYGEGLSRSRSSSMGNNGVAAFLALACATLTYERGEDALPIVNDGLAFYPAHFGLQLLKARILIDRGRPEEALPLLENLCAIDSATYADRVVSYDRRIFDVEAPDLMGVALLRLGSRAEAAAAFARAAAGAPDDMSYRIKAAALGAPVLSPAQAAS